MGYDAASFEGALGLADTHDMVYAALGVHPHNAKDFDAGVEKRLKELILRRKVLALGEIGLDFYRDLSPRERQREVFRRQIGIALYFEKPIIVHAREAFDDVITILDEEGALEVGGIFHDFSGSLDEATRGCHRSFRGCLRAQSCSRRIVPTCRPFRIAERETSRRMCESWRN